ncbi:hypothetical protein O3P69_015959 [Scylla paramamosain]|uniref:MBD domain-containing protein n=1 Tax=Scylla paramamosain TaxID=85552 RepID=A0AAW0TAW5_SCYPA
MERSCYSLLEPESVFTTRGEQRLSVPAAPEVTMAKFRFPGKALKLNTRKRVRFRGSHATHTPEELYTRRIRKGLDLFTQIFGDSDEDEDEFEGFISGQPEARVAGRTGTVPPRSRTGKRAAAQKAEEACLALEEAGLATTRRTSVVEGAVSEVREEGRSRTEGVSAQERVAAPQEPLVPGQDPLQGPGEECVQGAKPWQVAASNRVTRRQTNHRISRPPTVKTALAKKLLAKAKKKVPSLPVVGEKSPKRFILPTMSVRSSRIIKPNKRLFADITEICSPGGLPEAGPGAEAGEGSISVSPKRLVKLTRKGRGSHTQFLSLPRSRAQDKSTASGMEGVRRTISIYTEAMTGPCKGQVGRPPKRRVEAPQQEVEAEAPDSPQRCDPKESRVKEKIEKLLRSPWDNRLKQTAKGGKGEGEELMPAPSCTTSPVLAVSTLPRNILRRPRLNLNKTTLQRLRNPASLQRFIPACEGGSVEGKCAVCDIAGENFYKFGILFCEMCSSFLDKASAGLKEVMECLDGKGECQVQGLEVEDRCPACWLYRVLTSCSISNILHDHLRKRLPPHLKEQVPTSLARCMSAGATATSTEKNDELTSHMKRLPLDPGGGGAFGSVIDLPGGWRRKTGPEVIVISPSGEKFRSVQKLEEFLKKQGIRADARVLFGNSSPAVGQASESEAKSKPSVPGNGGSRGKVVMTMLPGGWTRRIKWRSAGDRFDTYVYSPDGRTFRSRRELSSYFSLIGKVDDIHKYFPVVTGHSDASIPSSSDTPGSSSTEPVSSSEPCSEVSSDDKSPEAAACQAGQRKHKFRKPSHLSKGKKSKIPQVKPQKLQEKARSKPPTQVFVMEESVEEGDRKDQESQAEASTSQFKQKQKVSSRTRTLSAGRKEDTSLTDTTESESEQRKPETIQMFSKTYTRGRSRKSKQVVSPPLFGNNSSSVCSPQFGKDKASSIAQETQKDTGDGNDMSTTVDAGDVNLSGKKQKIQEEGTASPEPFTVLPESGDKESSVQESDTRNTSGKASQDKRTKKAADQGSASPEPSALSVSDSKLTTKIVLKIPKKAIKIKPVRKKMNRGKRIKKKNNSAVKEEKQTSKLPFLEDKSWETKPLTDTKKLSDVTQGKLPSQEGGAEPAGSESDGLVNYDMTDKSRVVTSPSMSEGEGPQPFIVPGVKKTKPQKSSRKCETQHFGQGWTRRIRWNDRGEGRVSLLYSPDGQSFRSRIELSAYFKKAGKPRVDLDYYFPLALHRPASAADKDPSALVTSTSTQSSESSEFSDSDAFIKTSEDSWASSEETRRSQLSHSMKHYHRIPGVKNSMEDMVEEMPLSSYQNSGKPSSCLQTFQEDGRKLMPLPSKGGKNIVVSIHEVKRSGAVKSETEEGEELLDEAGGPRVKHVCRSQAQVLRITRAVFPSPKKEEDQMSSSVVTAKPKGEQKRKIVTVTTTSSGKVLRKTQWCGKCPGCTTP